MVRVTDQEPSRPPVERVTAILAEKGIDTVLCVLPDLWGRLMGKRVTVPTFLERIHGAHGLHASLYLFTVDLDMNPLPGFELTSWQTGFHDFRMVPDLSTFRLIPWQSKTALVLCDAIHEKSGLPVEIAPRQILRRQVARARAAGYSVKCGSELEFFLFKDSYDEAWERGYEALRPMSNYRADYHILQTTKDEWLIGQIRNGMQQAGIKVEFSKGEWGLGQHEINLLFEDALEMADRHVIYKNGVKEIAALNGRAATFMAKWAPLEIGSSFHIHSSLWNATGRESLMWDERAPHQMSPAFRHYLGGLMATGREMAWLFAPFVNSYKRYEVDSFAPTSLTWGDDNRTCGFRVVGEHESFRIEDRIPGADANPYLAFAATIAGGLHGLANRIEPPPIYVGNAYEAEGVLKVPTSLAEAISALETSAVTREALGDDVFGHLLQLARHEQLSFEAAGQRGEPPNTWDLKRYFERV